MRAAAPATIKDVARLARCGIATASRVLNKSGPASTDMRERVERAARDLGFSFNAAGRALQSRKSMTIGCLVPSLANPVFAEAVQGVQSELSGSGYQLLISCSNYDDNADNAAITTLLENNVDGIIATMVAPDRSAALMQAKQRDIAVSLMFHDPIDGLVTAYVDNFVAAAEVARRFAAFGHTRVGFLALRFSRSDRSRNRYSGFHDQCKMSGLAEPILIEISENEARHPERLAATLANYPDVTALFASNDFLAIAVQKATRHLGWQVPQDLSVVGFDGIEVGRLLETSLSTIETRPEAMGRQAAQSLLNALQGLGLKQRPPLPFSFREGETLAIPNPKRTDDDRVAAQPSSVHPAQDQNQSRTNP